MVAREALLQDRLAPMHLRDAHRMEVMVTAPHRRLLVQHPGLAREVPGTGKKAERGGSRKRGAVSRRSRSAREVPEGKAPGEREVEVRDGTGARTDGIAMRGIGIGIGTGTGIEMDVRIRIGIVEEMTRSGRGEEIVVEIATIRASANTSTGALVACMYWIHIRRRNEP